MARLSFLQTTAVSTDPRADHAFHFSQLHAILGRTSTLLEVFAAGFKDARGRIEEYVLLCRFFADSSLYFGLFDIPVAVGAAWIVLAGGWRTQVGNIRLRCTYYAGALGENAVERGLSSFRWD